MDQRKTVPGLDRFSELSCIIDDVLGLRDFLRSIIGTVFHVTVFKKVFNLVENIFNWGERVIVHFGHFFFEIVQLVR